MGSFPGHALPGSFFIVASLWWAANVFYSYNNARLNRKRYRSYAAYICTIFNREVPVEGVLKIVFAIIGCLGEIIWSFKYNFGILTGNVQHVTMFVFFGASGIVDVISHYKKNILPPNTDYACLLLAFINEALLFKFHLHDQSSVNVIIHTLLLYTILSTVVLMALETKVRYSPVVSLARSLSVLLQGTWFWQTGYLLFSSSETWKQLDEEDHGLMAVIVVMFSWHIFVDLIAIGVLGLLISCVQYRKQGKVLGYSPVRPSPPNLDYRESD